MSMNNWSRYFEEVSEFLQGAERQYGIANDAYRAIPFDVHTPPHR